MRDDKCLEEGWQVMAQKRMLLDILLACTGRVKAVIIYNQTLGHSNGFGFILSHQPTMFDAVLQRSVSTVNCTAVLPIWLICFILVSLPSIK